MLEVKSERKGYFSGISAYTLWGLLPLYFALLAPAGPWEIVANRILWSLIFCVILITATRSWAPFLATLRHGKTMLILTGAAVLIAINWFTYTVGVVSGHTVEAALGYYINPLVSVLLGVLILKEKLSTLQWMALGVGFTAVIIMTVAYGKVPWISLILAFSFGLYGLVKKQVGGGVSAVTSLSVETLVLTPVAAVVMIALALQGQTTLLSEGPGHFWIMAASGVITAVPLILFAVAATNLPLTTVGMLQYLAPTFQLIIAVLVFREPMPAERWIGFALVWVALIILTIDGLQRAFVRRRRARI